MHEKPNQLHSRSFSSVRPLVEAFYFKAKLINNTWKETFFRRTSQTCCYVVTFRSSVILFCCLLRGRRVGALLFQEYPRCFLVGCGYYDNRRLWWHEVNVPPSSTFRSREHLLFRRYFIKIINYEWAHHELKLSLIYFPN